jgi:predicted DNA-binding WGR domain protein
MPIQPHPEAAELVKLVREYGRIGQSGQVRLDLFPEIDAATHSFANTIKRKLRGGYVPCEQRLWN